MFKTIAQLPNHKPSKAGIYLKVEIKGKESVQKNKGIFDDNNKSLAWLLVINNGLNGSVKNLLFYLNTYSPILAQFHFPNLSAY